MLILMPLHLSRRALLLAGAAPLLAQRSSSDDLDFLHGLDEYENIREMLPAYMRREGKALLENRVRSLDVSTPEALARRRDYLRQCLMRAIGGLPERTPLNARVTGTVERDGYRIEKVVFESQPGFYVTANLYVPAGQPPFPAILYPLGHELGAKAHDTWQQMLVTLARKGYVALAWDTLGQGERIQLYDPDFRDSKVVNSTTEHTVQGIQCLLTGQHIARYTIWDGIRALDYLLSRKEVDAQRVACTGNSGGGTHTAYLSALDDRIRVAAPSCYITGWRRLLETIGPQDAEQVFPNWLRDGLDFPDFLYAAAPKPYLVLSAIRDFFPIDGARESFHEAERYYPEGKLRMVEADDGHGYTQPRRMAAYDWFAHWLKKSEDHDPEAVVTPESAETLFCTPDGQVSTSLGGETVFTLNRSRAQRLKAARPRLTDAGRLAAHQTRIRRAAIERSGFKPASGELKIRPYGSMARTGFRIDKLVYETDPGVSIPALLYLPENGASRKPAAVIVDGRGKSAAAGAAEQLVRGGAVVLSIDVRGLGETHARQELNAGDFYRYFGNYECAMTGILMGRTLVAMRALDVLRGVDLLSARPDVDPAKISGIGRQGGAASVLYAAVFDSRLRSIVLDGMLLSYEAVVNERIHRQVFEDVVPSALEDFDLPDLVAAVAPRGVWIFNPRSPQGPPALRREFEDTYESAVDVFRAAGAPKAIKLQVSKRDEDYGELLTAG
jgi:cephalosporin-C deacetylase-like acetyl esterase